MKKLNTESVNDTASSSSTAKSALSPRAEQSLYKPWRVARAAVSTVLRPPLNEQELKIEIVHVPYMSMPELKIPQVTVTHIPSGYHSSCSSYMTRADNEHAAKTLLSFQLDDWYLIQKKELTNNTITSPRK